MLNGNPGRHLVRSSGLAKRFSVVALATTHSRPLVHFQKPPAATEPSSWSTRDPYPRSSPSIPASPRTVRKPRVDQSPRRQDSESPKYRTPPSTPFQPGFYRKPLEDEPRGNPFPLPSPSLRRPRQPRTRRPQDDGSDSEDEV